MALSDVLPKYVEPCVTERINSIESIWLNPSELGEFCLSPKDSQTYPRLIAVYNGKILNIQSELIHASLSGISIKHHYGKCFTEEDDQSQIYQDYDTEIDDFDWLDKESDQTVKSLEKTKLNVSLASATENGSSDYLESLQVEGQPYCTLSKINYRNSFWNLHRPELCKLTWGQKYVSTAVVIEHLHEHLMQHGSLCQGFHTEEDRMLMLEKELDDYVRLKVLACPRELPPDEPSFDFKYDINKSKINPKCKRILQELKIPIQLSERIFQIDDEDDDDDDDDDNDDVNYKRLHRSKEEFCLTIGKHMRGSLLVQSMISISEGMITPQLSAQEEEDYNHFYYNWFLQDEEEAQEGTSERTTASSSIFTSDSLTPIESKRKLIENEFCRAAGKVDFSDLRCPDF